MQILFNGEPLDFTLEKERNLNDVITSVEKWLEPANLIITSLEIDGQEFNQVSRDNRAALPVEQIKTLIIITSPGREVRIESIHNVQEYLNLLVNGIRLADKKMLSELQDGYPFLLESLKHLFNYQQTGNIKDEINPFLEFFSGVNIITADKDEIISHTQDLLGKLDILLEEESNPLLALKNITTSLKVSIDEIKEVSILLQTGKDKNAMDAIVKFSDQMQRLLIIFVKLKSSVGFDFSAKIIAGQSVESFYNDLNKILAELLEAFAIKDFVLIGDLLEYEIAPRLEGVITFIEDSNKTRARDA